MGCGTGLLILLFGAGFGLVLVYGAISLLARRLQPAPPAPPERTFHELTWQVSHVREKWIQSLAAALTFAALLWAPTGGVAWVVATAVNDAWFHMDGGALAPWLLPIPALLLAAACVPWLAARARSVVIGGPGGVSIRRPWPLRSVEIPWAELVDVRAEGSILRVEAARGPVAMYADGPWEWVEAAADWLRAAREQAGDGGEATPEPPPEALRDLIDRGRSASGEMSR